MSVRRLSAWVTLLLLVGGAAIAEDNAPSTSTSAIVRQLWATHLVVRFAARDSQSVALYGALDSHESALSETLALLGRDREALLTLAFLGSLSVDGATAEDLACEVLSRGNAIQPVLAEAARAKTTPCAEVTADLAKRFHGDFLALTGHVCKSPSRYRDWAQSTSARVSAGERCEYPKGATK